MDKKEQFVVSEELIADEFAYNENDYVVLDTSKLENIKSNTLIMKLEYTEDGNAKLVAMNEKEYAEVAKYYVELTNAIDEAEGE